MSTEQSLSLVLYFAEVLGFFIIGGLVLLRQRNPLYKSFAAFVFSVGTWQALQLAAIAISEQTTWATSLFRISIVMAGVVAASFVVFASVYTGRQIRKFYYYVSGTIAGFLSLFSSNLQQVSISHTGLEVPKLDIWYGLLLLYAASGIIYGVLTIALHLKKVSDIKRRTQDSLMLMTVLFVGIIVIMASFYTSRFSETAVAQHIVPLTTLLGMMSFFYAIIYKGLFDIHFFVVRAAAYLATLLIMTFLLVVPIIAIFGYFLDFHPTQRVFVTVVVASVFVLYILQYLRRIFDRFTNKVFFRHYYDPQDVLDDLTNVLVRIVESEELRARTADILAKAVNPHFIDYLLRSEHDDRFMDLLSNAQMSIIVADELDDRKHRRLRKELEQRRVALAVKLQTHQNHLGFMVFGFKQSGEVYNLRDRRLLSIAADEIAIGLQNALHLKEIENFNATLQEKIEDATKQLRKKNERLRLLDQTKDDFISMASHQLRTPLTSVKGYTSMVLEGDAGRINSLQRKLLNQSFVSAQRMVYLISDLLNVSRLRTGKFELELIPTNLATVIVSEVEQLKETAASRNLKLTYTKPEHFPTYLLDETKIRQVIMNFIDNAIYYTPAGGAIEVVLADKPESIEFTVTDTGIGVPKRDQPHMFTKYFRARNAQVARPDGTGLGLFMAKKVIIAHGGAVIFKSRERKGSTFGFIFSKKYLQTPPPKAK